MPALRASFRLNYVVLFAAVELCADDRNASISADFAIKVF
jgi:hypothetical protein